MRSSKLVSNSLIVSPSMPLAPLRLSCRHVSRRNSGVRRGASEVKQALGSCFALAAIFRSCVDIGFLPLSAGDVSARKNLVLLPRFPMYAAFPRAEYYQGIRLPPGRLLSYGWSFRSAYSTPVKTPRDLPGSSDASVATRAVPLDPAGLSSSLAYRGCLLLAFHVFERVGVRAFITRLMWLHWRYGPRVALSTLHPCRYLHERKTRFPVGWLGPCRGGNDTRWKRRALPGAPKHPLISPSINHFVPGQSLWISLRAVWHPPRGLNPCEWSENCGS